MRVGLIGYGFVGKTFHAPLIAATKGLELACIASTQAARVHQDWPGVRVCTPEQLLKSQDVELVVIASPNETHVSLASSALRSGKHVVVDKPFTLHLHEAQQLTQLAQSQGKILSVFHNRRWDSDFLAVRKAIESGLIGRVVHFESHFDRYRPEVRDRWREQDVPGSGVWYDLGPHLIDQALQLFGTPRHIQVHLGKHRAGAQTDDWAHAVLEYDHCHVLLHASMLVASGSPRFTVHGEKGSLIKRKPDIQEAQLLAGIQPGSEGWGIDPDPLEFWSPAGVMEHLATPAGNQGAYYAQLRDALQGLGPIPVTAEQACQVMSVLAAT